MPEKKESNSSKKTQQVPVSFGSPRQTVKSFLRDSGDEFVLSVFDAAQTLTHLTPMQRTVAGCLKVLGDKFGSVTIGELQLAVLLVQIRCGRSKNNGKR